MFDNLIDADQLHTKIETSTELDSFQYLQLQCLLRIIDVLDNTLSHLEDRTISVRLENRF